MKFYKERLADNPKFKLKILHFFVDTGIRDTLYYWGELKKAIRLYCEMKPLCKDLHGINIGGGMPIRNSLGFAFNYKYMIKEIVRLISEECEEAGVPNPIFSPSLANTPFGESGAVIFSVLAQKQQNDAEVWYMIDNSLMTTLPDAWGIGERFVLLPINKWDSDYRRLNIGGLSCDNSDYYRLRSASKSGLSAFFPTGRKGTALPRLFPYRRVSGFHQRLRRHQTLLIPSPKHILLYRDSQGNLVDELYQPEQSADEMLKILGY